MYPLVAQAAPADAAEARALGLAGQEAPQAPAAAGVGRLSLAGACRLLEVDRVGYYRWRQSAPGLALGADLEAMQVRDQMQRIALEMPSYGYRRITHELRRQGYGVNHKRVLRWMRDDNLLCLRRKSFVATTDSAHGLPVYPNLVPQLQLSRLDQLWVADITYIRLAREFIYLAVVLDAFSRRCIGWALERSLHAELTLAALRQALTMRHVTLGAKAAGQQLVHHSDRGVQYAATAYTTLLGAYGIDISMSRRGNPYDNAMAESFLKTLKYEEVYLFEYEHLAEARSRISHFLEAVYNQKRLHSALGYRPPAEFEQALAQGEEQAAGA
jgi:putative transposase